MRRLILAETPVLALVPWLVAAGADPEVARLQEGSSLEREISRGETHRYAIDLKAGDYVQVHVEQQGADVGQKLVGPDGGVILEADSPCGPIGPEPLAFVAGSPGVYRLELAGLDLAVPPRGRYTIRVEALREPTSADRVRVEAVRAAADALLAQGKDRRAELAHYEAARAAWVTLGDRRMQLWMQEMIGFSRAFDLDDLQGALTTYRSTLALAQELGDEWAESRISDDLSQVELRLGNLERTRELMERALEISLRAGRTPYVARMQTVLGSYFSLIGEPQAALDRLYAALEVNRRLGVDLEVARTRIEIGATYLRLGDPELALDQYEQALPALAADAGRRARCITEMGVARLKLGEHDPARRAFEEALAIYHTLENRIAEADTLVALGDLARDKGQLEPALKHYSVAAATCSAHAYPLGLGKANCRVGDVQRRLGDAAAARAAFTAVLAAPASGGTARACAELGLARLEERAGSLDDARRHAEAAMELVEAQRNLASPRAREAALAESQSAFEVEIDVLMRAHEQSPAAGHDAAAFEVSERARARSLLDLLREGRVDVTEGVRPELLAEERALRHRLNATAASAPRSGAPGKADSELDRLSAQLADVESRIRSASPHYAALTQSRPSTLEEIRARVLDPDTQLVQYALGEEDAYVWVVSADRLDSARLPARSQIESAARRLHELLSSPPSGGDARLRSARDELSRLVLAPVAARLVGRRLLLVAPGALQYVPFASLLLPDGAPMLSRFELVSAPSASVIATLRDEPRDRGPAPKAAAVFADPVFERTDPRVARVAGASADATSRDRQEHAPPPRVEFSRLPFSRGEADSILSLMAPDDALAATGFAASRSAATSPRLVDYRIVHFATHAVLNTRQPELSGVVLSLYDARGQAQDGFLRLHDVYNLRLGADLVVLSGCQTALGKDLKGEGLIGLARGFMYAGARGVVASLWQVDDASTSELMKRFYRAMLKDGKKPAAALRAAQLDLARDARWSAPFHWAGFALQGDWR